MKTLEGSASDNADPGSGGVCVFVLCSTNSVLIDDPHQISKIDAHLHYGYAVVHYG